MEKLCGTCSQDQGLTLEERIELAKSRLPNVEYTCPICGNSHVYRGQIKPSALETTMEQETWVEENSGFKNNQNGNQLSLF